MKHSLLNCEGDFLLAEKLSDTWYFKLLIEIQNGEKSRSGYAFIETDPVQILNFLKGEHTVEHEQYPEGLNYSNYNDDYKSRRHLIILINELVNDLKEEISEDSNSFYDGFLIPKER